MSTALGLGLGLPFRVSTGFNPAALFAAGEQGAWYDPSDLTTLFQESLSIVSPVTAVEQSVYLMLDKSKGLALGSELVTNGDFSNGTTGWTGFAATIAVNAGRLQVTPTDASSRSGYQSVTTVVGSVYKVVGQYEQGTATGVIFRVRNAAPNGVIVYTSSTLNGSGTFQFYFIAGDTTSVIELATASGNTGNSAFFDNVSIKQVAGNHAYQSTSTSRPVLRARYNLLTYSEQFDNAAWTKGAATVTANTSIAPDGTTTADTFTSTNTSQQHYLQPTAASALTTYNLNYTGSISVKAGTHNFITVSFSSGGATTWAAVTVNLSTGVITQTSNGALATLVSASISSQGNGWYRVSLTASYSSGGPGTFLWVSSSSSGTPTYGNYGMETWLAAGTETILVWGAQLVVTNSLPSNTYQRIAAATDYNTTGFLPYLAFDGTDDSLLTNSVDFSATDKMTVWAGVRKLSDATAGTLCELGAAPATVDGMFGLSPGDYATGTGAYWIHGARGTAALNSNQYAVTPATFASPITNVLAGASDIAGDLSVIRANGVQQATATGDKGAGNFSNNPLYIGRRNNATQPFNGNLYSLIIRGAQSSSAQISSTETWVAQKTGVTL